MNEFLAILFYHLGDFTWKVICWTDWNEITRKLISGPCWSLYQKFMSLSLDYDERAGYIVWKLPENE